MSIALVTPDEAKIRDQKQAQIVRMQDTVRRLQAAHQPGTPEYIEYQRQYELLVQDEVNLVFEPWDRYCAAVEAAPNYQI